MTEKKYVFINKDNPKLAIDLMTPNSFGGDYPSLVDYEGQFNSVNPFSLSEVSDFNLSKFHIVPLPEGQGFISLKDLLGTVALEEQ